MFDFDTPITKNTDLEAQYKCLVRDAIIIKHMAGTGSTVLTNHWNGPITVTLFDGSEVELASAGSTYNIQCTNDTVGKEIKISAPKEVFESWASYRCILRSSGTSTSVECELSVPSLEPFLINGDTAGNYFFYGFCSSVAQTSTVYYMDCITTIKEGSFDTSMIKKVGNNFFAYFAAGDSVYTSPTSGARTGRLTMLPEGSFDFSNIEEVGSSFCAGFAEYSSPLFTTLPAGSFRFSNRLTTVGNNFFAYFNQADGGLTSLPEGSFNIDSITTAGTSFFYNFNNHGGRIKTLPAGSFNTSNLTSVGNYCFSCFSGNGALEALPDGSFNLEKLASIGDYCFENFIAPLSTYSKKTPKITTLPAGSFRFGPGLSKIDKTYFFFNFARSSKLKSIPEGAFNLEHITTVSAEDFFYYAFGETTDLTTISNGCFDTSNIAGTVGGAFFSSAFAGSGVTQLPAGSFNIDKIVQVGASFFSSFNSGGSLTSLPAGSFNTSNITSCGSMFFTMFNKDGALTSLPDGSFVLNAGLIPTGSIFSYFNDGGKLTSLPAGSFNTDNLTSLGNSCFEYFNRKGALTELPDGSFNFDAVKTVGTDVCDGFNTQGELAHLPEGSFSFRNATSLGNYTFRQFNMSGSLVDLPKGSFDIQNVTKIGNYVFSAFNSNGQLTDLPEGSFKLDNVNSYGDYAFYQFNKDGSQLTSLPPESFNVKETATFGTSTFNGFNTNGALTRGNNKIKIYAVKKITNFNVGDQVNIEAGEYGYVDDGSATSSLTGLKEALANGTAKSIFPIGTELPDTWNGEDNPLIVAHYLDSSNNSAYNGAEGVVLVRKYADPISIKFHFDYGTDYSEAIIRLYLDENYLWNCSTELLSVIDNIDVPFNNTRIPSKWFLMSATEMYGLGYNNVVEGTAFDYWKEKSGLSAPINGDYNNKVPGWVITDRDGKAHDCWLRTKWDTNYNVAIFSSGYLSPLASSTAALAPACFISAKPKAEKNLFDLKLALNAGTAAGSYPVGTEIPDTYAGNSNPLIVAQYLDSTNNSKYAGAEGVVLVRKYADPTAQEFGPSSSVTNYEVSEVRQFLDTTYLNNCSLDLKHTIGVISIPYYNTLATVNVPSKWFLMSDTEVMYVADHKVEEGIGFDYWKQQTGLGTPNTATNAGRKATNRSGTAVSYWLRSLWSDYSGVDVITTTGGGSNYTGSTSMAILPACFISKDLDFAPDFSIKEFRRLNEMSLVKKYFPVGMMIQDKWDGKDDPLVVGTYTSIVNNSSKKTENVIGLFRRYLCPVTQKFGSYGDYPTATLLTYLKGDYLSKCSIDLRLAYAIEARAPYYSEANGNSYVASRVHLFSAEEVCGEMWREGSMWEYWQTRTGLTTPNNNANFGRCMYPIDGTRADNWLRTSNAVTSTAQFIITSAGAIQQSSKVTTAMRFLPIFFIRQD